MRVSIGWDCHVHRYYGTEWLIVRWVSSGMLELWYWGCPVKKRPSHAYIWPFSLRYCKIMRKDRLYFTFNNKHVKNYYYWKEYDAERLWYKFYSYILSTVDSLLNPEQFHSNVFPHVLKRFIILWVLGLLGNINWRCS